MPEEKEQPKNPVVTSILSNLKNWFGKKKEISHIRVNTPKQSFWVSDPKKIKFWRGLAVAQAGALIQKPDELPGVRISKVIYKEDKK